jgi:hypothetical protein
MTVRISLIEIFSELLQHSLVVFIDQYDTLSFVEYSEEEKETELLSKSRKKISNDILSKK